MTVTVTLSILPRVSSFLKVPLMTKDWPHAPIDIPHAKSNQRTETRNACAEKGVPFMEGVV